MGEQAKILARVLARRLIDGGATELPRVWPVYLEFADAGGDGDFAHLLVTRGIATPEQIEAARTARGGLENSASSGSDVGGMTELARRPAGWRTQDLEEDPTPPPRRRPSARQRPDVARPRPPSARQRPDVARPRPPSARQRPGMARQRPEVARQPPDRTLDFDTVLPPPEEPPATPRPAPPPARDLNPIDPWESEVTPPREPAETVAGSGAVDAAFADTQEHSPGEHPGVDGAPPPPAPGDELGPYTLEEEIGRGAMGVVYRARQTGSAHAYALKVLSLEGATSKRAARFKREMEVLRQLDHPNLIRIHDSGTEGPYEWFAMDLVEGGPLKTLLAEHRFSPKEKLEVFGRICAGVAHAHQQGIIHRDLKPANVLVGDGLSVTVLDFGLAKLTEPEGDAQELTQAGTSLGTPWYMSPELVSDPKSVDARSDVFTLGILLYEMLTGRRPFVGQAAGEVFERILNLDPTPLNEINTFVHPDVSAICLKALEKDREQRYQTADAVLADLQRHQAGQGVRKPLLRRPLRWLSRHRGGFLVGLILASAGWGGLLYLLSERL